MSRIETSRLILRPHCVDDVDACAAMWGDTEVTRYIGGRPSTRHEAWMRVMRYAGHWSLLGFGFWVIQEKATGRFLGEAGLADFRRGVSPEFDSDPELGWVLNRDAWGQGFATEAVQAGLQWAEQKWGPRRTVCMIEPANQASLRVASKCGYREFGRTQLHGDTLILLER